MDLIGFRRVCWDTLNPELIFVLLGQALAVASFPVIQIAHRNAGVGANGETRPRV